MYRKLLFAIAAVLLVAGLVLCRLEFGTMFWGNWLHSTSFTIGVLAALLGVGILVGVGTSSSTFGVIALVALLFLYGVFFWTFFGWLVLYKLIHWLFIPGPMPEGF